VVGSEIERAAPAPKDNDPAPLTVMEPVLFVVKPPKVMLIPELMDTDEAAEKYAVSPVAPGHEPNVPVAEVRRQVFAASQLPVPPTAVVVAPLASQ
jgi:hypothetical protein